MAKNQQITGIWTWLGTVGFILLVMACVAIIYPARRQYVRQLEFYTKIKTEADIKRAERDALQREVTMLKTSPNAVEKIAREKFRLCKEGEVIMYYKRPASVNGR
ncbi:MAG: septum formation initiator family protein [Lentisphaerae bacterium]|nr:septum formation initiator family protein [Lentisphaerota bacterium]